jgi:methanethiol oxidase
MVASEWASPNLFKDGFAIDHLSDYGRNLNFYSWSDQKLFQTIDLGVEGSAPLEVRFFHNPKRAEGFVGCCVFANVYR